MKLGELLETIDYGTEIHLSNGAKEIAVGSMPKFEKNCKYKDRIVTGICPYVGYMEDDDESEHEYSYLNIRLYFKDDEL